MRWTCWRFIGEQYLTKLLGHKFTLVTDHKGLNTSRPKRVYWTDKSNGGNSCPISTSPSVENKVADYLSSYLLSCRYPHPIAEILSDPRLIRYCSSNSILTILQDSDTTLTKPLNSKHPLRPLMHYHRSPRTLNDLREPQSHSCLHLYSSFHFNPLEL